VIHVRVQFAAPGAIEVQQIELQGTGAGRPARWRFGGEPTAGRR
jgi:hypothetical protein